MNGNIHREDVKVRHEPPAKRFAVRLDNKIAYLSYEERGNNVLDYAHTYVPDEYRKRGIASAITRYALDWAREKGYSIIPSCSFVEDYINNNPEYRDIVK